ncbi:MAG: hypothetical protein KAG28_04795 [Cocleimonas sp.]|nr:hypothetical protein [Cocleimonas sp.]
MLRYRKKQKNPRFLYLLFEVVIIVLGVYLGFQIEDWSEDKKEQSIEKQYLDYLLIDLDRDILLMEKSFINRYDKKIKGLELAKNYALGKTKPKDKKKFISDIGYGAVFSSGIPSVYSGTYNELVNSGNLRLIKNSSLRKEISAYYSYIEQTIRSQEKSFSGYLTVMNSLRPFDLNNPSYISPSDQKILLKNIKKISFIKTINLEITFANSIVNNAKKIKNNAYNLKAHINQQINSINN